MADNVMDVVATCQHVSKGIYKEIPRILDMSETFGEWLKLMMRRRGLSQSDLARGADVTRSAVSRWVNDLALPDTESCVRLARFFNEPIEHVYALAGHPVNYEPRPPQPRSIREQALEFLAGMPVAVPVFDQLASAGPGQTVMDYVYLEPGYETDGRYIAIRVKGRSMEPDLRDGDTVILDTEAVAEVGELVVATVGDEVFVKELRRKGDHLVLVGRDKREIPADDAKIEGVAIQTIRALRRR